MTREDIKNAVDKQVPKSIAVTKPFNIVCGSCNKPIDKLVYKYCPFCGQRIDWHVINKGGRG